MSENKSDEIPEVMMAVQLIGNGGPEKLSIRHDIPVPKIGEDQVLIRVKTLRDEQHRYKHEDRVVLKISYSCDIK